MNPQNAYLSFMNKAWGERFLGYLEIFILLCLSTLVLTQLKLLSGIDVWRQDSMYYVSGYDDKLASEGRWINYIFFDWLKQIPAFACIVISYACVGTFIFLISEKIVKNWRYSLAVALLVLNVPVLSVQLEWPETLLIAFLLLPIAAIESNRIPDYVFFPLFSCLFFGTFSAFYFLLPLLFINKLTPKGALRLVGIWLASFFVGYAFTNFIVYLYTGSGIEISGWRHPHPIKNVGDLITNITIVYNFFIRHMMSFGTLLHPVVLCFAAVLVIIKCRSLHGALVLLITLAVGLAIYLSAIPMGIIVQARTTLTFWIAAAFAIFVYYDHKKYLHPIGLILILASGIYLSKVSISSIKSYAKITDALTRQAHFANLLPQEEMDALFIVAESTEVDGAYRKLAKNLNLNPYFSEVFADARGWAPIFKSMGYSNIIVCFNDDTGWCTKPVTAYRNSKDLDTHTHLFKTYNFGEHMVVGINENFVAQPSSTH
jgi:hypothetical protein